MRSCNKLRFSLVLQIFFTQFFFSWTIWEYLFFYAQVVNCIYMQMCKTLSANCTLLQCSSRQILKYFKFKKPILSISAFSIMLSVMWIQKHSPLYSFMYWNFGISFLWVIFGARFQVGRRNLVVGEGHLGQFLRFYFTLAFTVVLFFAWKI